ncbi:hypothetical protein [Sphingomonas sp. CFBP 13720]|uniref:hypothetical protein n=1 Tax=Sphingomonas sp. CFBP 13720 TaxID=2775302 RepID=UPI001782A338|nr:hypothetical protein [Sphingomonas sp. CFBP 13720]MBD8677620.1 hypothetical protein [Sphingomonas sp. CFBP 13720]
MRPIFATMMCALLAACGNAGSTDAVAEGEGNRVDLRHLVETDVAGDGNERLKLEGTVIPTPSDPKSRYELLRQRRTVAGTTIAILRQQRGERVAYARTELDCDRQLFHVVGVADTRVRVETDTAHDGPLRSTEGLPLRQELSRFICARQSA